MSVRTNDLLYHCYECGYIDNRGLVLNYWCETCLKPFGRDKGAAVFHQEHYGHQVFSREVEGTAESGWPCPKCGSPRKQEVYDY